MPDIPTPGQICYEAFQCDCGCWRDLDAFVQQRWETAAQAALVHFLRTSPLFEGLAYLRQFTVTRDEARGLQEEP